MLFFIYAIIGMQVRPKKELEMEYHSFVHDLYVCVCVVVWEFGIRGRSRLCHQ